MLGIDIIDAGLLTAMAFALFGGLLSFLSPCVLPVALPYLAYMGGVSVRDMGEDSSARRRALFTAMFFVLGLSTVFLILGFAFSAMGMMFLEWQDWFITGAGVLVIGFGLHFLGVYRIKFLDQEARLDAGDRGGSAFGAYVLGLAFAFGWTPCLGPILGGILTLAASEGDVSRGTFLLALYAAGLGIPFLLLAAFLPRLSGLMAWLKRHLNAVEKTSGALLVLVGLLLVTGKFTDIANWLLSTFPALGYIG
ncbi:Cytochrome c-type biogenesis CcdA-like protein [Candidatus Rhodobacter oscarellae]|uniref:Cytochrome c-type biogenesis CcdA-like protein n=1 Tax=Candidatus Rhodobacter oscarellae TaxID=1675527 RepID=A0A0J9E453_9RHOB|nr:cytochrome c biogenesis protein CcdA [Candidatus Rhodobacter lobularis]KMW57502.1 Cytochrome c-type biogenesis CcdA-like protein [Candidatus Rhodobacter lobularis]